MQQGSSSCGWRKTLHFSSNCGSYKVTLPSSHDFFWGEGKLCITQYIKLKEFIYFFNFIFVYTITDVSTLHPLPTSTQHSPPSLRPPPHCHRCQCVSHMRSLANPFTFFHPGPSLPPPLCTHASVSILFTGFHI